MKLLRKITRIVPVLFLLFALSVQVVFAQGKNFTSKIAIIDIYYLLDNSLAVKTVKTAMKIHNDKISSTLELKEKELKLLESNLKKKSSTNTNNNLEKEMTYFNNKVKEVQMEIKKKNVVLERAYTKSMQQINDTTTKIVERLSKKYGFNIVIPSAQIYYASPDIDITEEVITLLNKELPTIELQFE